MKKKTAHKSKLPPLTKEYVGSLVASSMAGELRSALRDLECLKEASPPKGKIREIDGLIKELNKRFKTLK